MSPHEEHALRLEAVCSYLSAPGMQHQDLVLEEARILIRKEMSSRNLILQVARAGRMELLELVEEVYGPDIWRQSGITVNERIQELEALKMESAIADRIYRGAVRSMGEKMKAHLVVSFGFAGAYGSKPLMRALLEECPPDAAQLAQLLVDARFIESAALRPMGNTLSSILSQTRFDDATLGGLYQTSLTRGHLRTIAILAKMGIARPAPDHHLSISSCGECRSFNAALSSNHGRMAIAMKLPAVSELISRPSRQLRRMVIRALPAA